MPVKTNLSLRYQTAIRALILVLAGMLIGGTLAMHLHGQSQSSQASHVQERQNRQDQDLIGVQIKVSIMEGTIANLLTKLDHLQSEADTTQAMGAGIGIAITGLQLLGFFTKSRQGG